MDVFDSEFCYVTRGVDLWMFYDSELCYVTRGVDLWMFSIQSCVM